MSAPRPEVLAASTHRYFNLRRRQSQGRAARDQGFSIRRYLQQRLGSIPENAALRDLVRKLTDPAGKHIEAEVRRREQA